MSVIHKAIKVGMREQATNSKALHSRDLPAVVAPGAARACAYATPAAGVARIAVHAQQQVPGAPALAQRMPKRSLGKVVRGGTVRASG